MVLNAILGITDGKSPTSKVYIIFLKNKYFSKLTAFSWDNYQSYLNSYVY